MGRGCRLVGWVGDDEDDDDDDDDCSGHANHSGNSEGVKVIDRHKRRRHVLLILLDHWLTQLCVNYDGWAGYCWYVLAQPICLI